MTLSAGREEAPEPQDLRAIVEAAARRRWGVAPMARLSEAVAPHWGLRPRIAAQRISRWLRGRGDITTDALAPLLAVLDIAVVSPV